MFGFEGLVWRKDPPLRGAPRVESRESYRLVLNGVLLGRAGAVFDIRTLQLRGFGWYIRPEADQFHVPPTQHTTVVHADLDTAKKEMLGYVVGHLNAARLAANRQQIHAVK